MLDPGRGPSSDRISQAAISVRGLAKSFAGRSVFETIDLDVPPGQSVAVIGSNGTGKSTLLRCLIGLTVPDRGTVHVLGQAATGIDRRSLIRLRSQVGFVFQKHNLVTRLSVLSNVVHGAQAQDPGPRNWLQCLATTRTRRRALDCLERVGLADRALQTAGSLSGGQSQRVAVARMLMQSPRLILADEPDASLDPQAGFEVMSLLRGICRDAGTTLVFVSHHMEHAAAFADRIVGLARGRVGLDRSAGECDPARLRAFFSDPAEEPAPLEQVA